MDNIKLFLKGILIGIGKIIPGVSGSMIAISLGLYEKMIYSLSHIMKNFKEHFLFLFKIGLGMLVAIILISKLILISLNNYFLPTMLLFIGLIVGGLPSIIKIAKQKRNRLNILILLIPFFFFLILDIITKNVDIDIELNIINALWLGIIEAFTMIIPGISGTAIMIMLGVYEEILEMFSNFNNPSILILFLMGMMLGIYLISKLINYVLNNYRISCYYAIIGFVSSSVIILLRKVLTIQCDLKSLAIGLILLLIGTFISYKIE